MLPLPLLLLRKGGVTGSGGGLLVETAGVPDLRVGASGGGAGRLAVVVPVVIKERLMHLHVGAGSGGGSRLSILELVVQERPRSLRVGAGGEASMERRLPIMRLLLLVPPNRAAETGAPSHPQAGAQRGAPRVSEAAVKRLLPIMRMMLLLVLLLMMVVVVLSAAAEAEQSRWHQHPTPSRGCAEEEPSPRHTPHLHRPRR